MLISAAFLLAELDRLGTAFARAGLRSEDVARIVAATKENIGLDGKVPLFALIPVWDPAQSRLWSLRATLVAGAAGRAYLRDGQVLPYVQHVGDYRVGAHEQRIVCASLEISGRLLLEEGARLVVLGDLTATDSLELDPDGGYQGCYAEFGCGGDLHVDELVSTGGCYSVAGNLRAKIVLASGNHGALVIGGDLTARVLCERDHNRSVVCGHAEVDAALVDSMLDRDDEAATANLLRLVQPGLRPALRRALAEYDDDPGVETDADEPDVEAFLRHHALTRRLL